MDLPQSSDPPEEGPTPQSTDPPEEPTPQSSTGKTKTAEGKPKLKSLIQLQSSDSSDPNCAICLEPLQNKCFVGNCFHTFCKACLFKWSAIKAECPLCKKAFTNIIYNVRSIEDYDEFHIMPQRPDPSCYSNARSRLASLLNWNRLLAQWRLNVENTANRQWEFHRHRVLYAPHTLDANTPMEQPAETPAPSTDVPVYARNDVYSFGLWSKKPQDRVRSTTPQFYQQNPSCHFRLVPWLNRELAALLNENDLHVLAVLELILALIMRYDITSKEFFVHVHPYLMDNTSHFVHEFHNFASSPDDIVQYDRNLSYYHPKEQETSASSESPDVIIISCDTPTPSTSATIVAVPSASMKKVEKCDKSGAKVCPRQTQRCCFWNMSHSRQSTSCPKFNRFAAANPMPSTSIVIDIADESGDNSQFIRHITAKTQMSPEVIDLVSDSEDDTLNPPIAVDTEKANIGETNNVKTIAKVESINVQNDNDSGNYSLSTSDSVCSNKGTSTARNTEKRNKQASARPQGHLFNDCTDASDCNLDELPSTSSKKLKLDGVVSSSASDTHRVYHAKKYKKCIKYKLRKSRSHSPDKK